jgi:hypothetical protein
MNTVNRREEDQENMHHDERLGDVNHSKDPHVTLWSWHTSRSQVQSAISIRMQNLAYLRIP